MEERDFTQPRREHGGRGVGLIRPPARRRCPVLLINGKRCRKVTSERDIGRTDGPRRGKEGKGPKKLPSEIPLSPSLHSIGASNEGKDRMRTVQQMALRPVTTHLNYMVREMLPLQTFF